MVYQLRLHHGHGVNCIVIGKKVMATEKKDRPWDGKSRPSDDNYRKRWNEIFGKDKDKFNKLQQEQRDLDASYQQSKLNKKERDDKEE